MVAVGVRVGVVLIIVSAHIALLFVLSQRQRRESANARSMQLVYVPPREVLVPPLPTSKPLDRRRSTKSRIEDAPFRPADEAPPAIPPVDWHASASAAASDAVAQQIRRESYRNFGVPNRDPAEHDTQSIFEEPKHKAGDVVSDQATGTARVYHTEHCFTQLDYPTLKDPVEELKPKINPPRCMYDVGKKQANGQLFNELKKKPTQPDLREERKEPSRQRSDAPDSR